MGDALHVLSQLAALKGEEANPRVSTHMIG